MIISPKCERLHILFTFVTPALLFFTAFFFVACSSKPKVDEASAPKPVASPPPSVSQLGAGACRVSQLVGFNGIENWGVWSQEDPATIKLERAITGPLDVNFTGYALNDHTAHVVKVTIGAETKSVTLTSDSPRTFRIHYVLPKPADEIVLSGIKPVSPKAAGLSSDERMLGVGLVSVECIPEGKPVTP